MLTDGNFTPASYFQNVDILFACRNYRTFSAKIQENTGTKMPMVGFFILKRISKNIYNFIAYDFMRISKNGLDPVIFFSTPSISSCQLAQISLLLFVSPYYYILTSSKSMRKMQTVLMKIQLYKSVYRKNLQRIELKLNIVTFDFFSLLLQDSAAKKFPTRLLVAIIMNNKKYAWADG